MARRSRRRWIATTLAGTALGLGLCLVTLRPPSAAAKPGTVTSLDGQPFTGDVTEDDRYVYVTTPGGIKTQLDRRNVSRVEYAADTQAGYDQRHAKLTATDVKGRLDLAKWATDHSRPDLSLAALEEARQVDPANREVALATDAAQRQVDLDRHAGRSATTAAVAAAGGSSTKPTTMGMAMTDAPEYRMLNPAEINVVRQFEMRTEDRLVRVRLENNVAHRYLLAQYGSATAARAKLFMKMTGEEQGLEILTQGPPEMAKDVRILTDPTPLQIFKTKVMPIIAQSCASASCHGGPNAGDFVLYEGNSTAAVYTNFFILTNYAAQVGGVKYLPVDRESPERSLVLQYGLPPLQGRPPHPAVKGYRARFTGRDDPNYGLVDDWITYDLRVIQHDYGFNVSPRLAPGQKVPGPTAAAGPGPSTQPSATRPTDAKP